MAFKSPISSAIICQICSNSPQRYCCPRCNILYCSIKCYQAEAHIQCAETFYKECVVQEMAQKPDTSDSVKRMYETLQRMEGQNVNDQDDMDDLYENDSNGEEELDSDDDVPVSGEDLAERLADVDLNDANAVWAKMTTFERTEFENLVFSGDASQVLPVTEPWWTQKQTKPLIEEVTSNAPHKAASQSPPIYTNIVDFSKISSKPPANCVPHNLTNVLAAYSITYRYFNGDHISSAQEATNYLVSVCANLKKNANFEDDELAIHSVAHDCQDEGIDIEKGQLEALRQDVDNIVEGPIRKHPSNAYVLAALSDVHKLLSTTAKNMKALAKSDGEKMVTGEFSKRFVDHQNGGLECVTRSVVSASLRKIEYYLAFVNKFR